MLVTAAVAHGAVVETIDLDFSHQIVSRLTIIHQLATK